MEQFRCIKLLVLFGDECFCWCWDYTTAVLCALLVLFDQVCGLIRFKVTTHHNGMLFFSESKVLLMKNVFSCNCDGVTRVVEPHDFHMSNFLLFQPLSSSKYFSYETLIECLKFCCF